jgi:hypothetical protein
MPFGNCAAGLIEKPVGKSCDPTPIIWDYTPKAAEGTPLVDLGQRAPPRRASNPAMTGRSDWIQILGYSWLLMLAAGLIVAVVLLS